MPQPVFITQLIYVKPGQENIFHQFEDLALPLLDKYRGKLLVRLRPAQEQVIASTIECPYEIHFISFEDNSDFEAFMLDEERKKFLNLKDQSIRQAILVKGQLL